MCASLRLVVLGWLVLGVMMSGCATRSVVKNPEAITLRAALSDLGQGLGDLIRAQPAEGELGLYPAEISVNFDVCASASGDGSLCVAPASTELGKATLNAGSKEEAKRSNSVSVRFVNVLFAPPESLVQKLSGEQLYAVRAALHGVDPRAAFVEATDAGKTTAPGPRLSPLRFLSAREEAEDPVSLVIGLDDSEQDRLGTAINAHERREAVPLGRGTETLRAIVRRVRALGWSRDDLARALGGSDAGITR